MQKKSQDLETGMKLLYLIKGLIHLKSSLPESIIEERKKRKKSGFSNSRVGFFSRLFHSKSNSSIRKNPKNSAANLQDSFMLNDSINVEKGRQTRNRMSFQSISPSLPPRKILHLQEDLDMTELIALSDACELPEKDWEKDDGPSDFLPEVSQEDPPGGESGLKHHEFRVCSGAKFIREAYQLQIQRLDQEHTRKNALRILKDIRKKPKYVEIREKLLGQAYGYIGMPLTGDPEGKLQTDDLPEGLANIMIQSDKLFDPLIQEEKDLDKSIDHPIELDAIESADFFQDMPEWLRMQFVISCKLKKSKNLLSSMVISFYEGTMVIFQKINWGSRKNKMPTKIRSLFVEMNKLKTQKFMNLN